jgi:hypothetical protein
MTGARTTSAISSASARPSRPGWTPEASKRRSAATERIGVSSIASASDRAVSSAAAERVDEDDEIGAAHDVVVAAAFDAVDGADLAGALLVARADGDVPAEDAQALRERLTERARAADDRDLHRGAPATSSTASATRRRVSGSSSNVGVTTVRTLQVGRLVLRSMTSASMRPS